MAVRTALPALDEQMVAVSPETFREGMAKVAAAVHIVTVRDGERVAGATVTAVCSLSDNPSSLLVCLYRGGQVRNLLRPGLAMSVNTLLSGQEAIADCFAGRHQLTMAERFETGGWLMEGEDAPFLPACASSFSCLATSIVEAETHSIVVARVHGIRLGATSDVLLYGARAYKSLVLA